MTSVLPPVKPALVCPQLKPPASLTPEDLGFRIGSLTLAIVLAIVGVANLFAGSSVLLALFISLSFLFGCFFLLSIYSRKFQVGVRASIGRLSYEGWQRIFRLQDVRVELLILKYRGVLQPASRNAHRATFQEVASGAVRLDLRQGTEPLNDLHCDPEVVRAYSGLRQSWNSLVYRFESIACDPLEHRTQLIFGPGCYLDYVYSCEAIGRELDRRIKSKPLTLIRRRLSGSRIERVSTDYADLLRELPMRRMLAETTELLLDPYTKCLKLGINNVTILRDSESASPFIILIGKRSGSIVEHPGMYHVVPAGTFEPSTDERFFDPREMASQNTVLRELFEECLLGDSKGVWKQMRYPLDAVFKQPEIARVRELLESSTGVQFAVGGVYSDMYNGKLEMTTSLLVEDESCARSLLDKMEPSWEYSGPFMRVRFSRRAVEEIIGDDRTLPIGAIALEDAMRSWPDLLAP